MYSVKKYLQPLEYKNYLPGLIGMWFIAFAVGIWFGDKITGLAAVIFLIGLVIHGVSMHAAHRQPHKH